jgi:3D (Asp-Asp-Asp) domain-containing protein
VKRTFSIAFLVILLLGFLPAQTRRPGRARTFEATAYAQRSATASGVKSQRGVVAANPHILPLGTEIQVRNAGRYSGTYMVADTGPKVQGRRIDIFIPNPQHAKRFGKKAVEVKVLHWGSAPARP